LKIIRHVGPSSHDRRLARADNGTIGSGMKAGSVFCGYARLGHGGIFPKVSPRL